MGTTIFKLIARTQLNDFTSRYYKSMVPWNLYCLRTNKHVQVCMQFSLDGAVSISFHTLNKLKSNIKWYHAKSLNIYHILIEAQYRSSILRNITVIWYRPHLQKLRTWPVHRPIKIIETISIKVHSLVVIRPLSLNHALTVFFFLDVENGTQFIIFSGNTFVKVEIRSST